ncbi:unnamed protein product [Closterium sp. NIES-54]
MAAAKRVLRYLCSTSGLGLVLGGRSPVVLTGHADASFGFCADALVTLGDLRREVLQRFDFTYSSPQATPLSTRHSFSALPSDESVEPSGPYPELVGCLMYLMTCTRPDLAYPLSILARYVAPGRHRPEHMAAAKRVLRYLCSTSGLGLVLGGRSPVVLTGHADASWFDDLATQRSSQGYTFSLGSGSVSWRSTRSSSILSSSCEAEIYAGAMAAQELRWLTYLLTDLGEPPRSPPVLYVDNKAMLALCREHRLEHRTKHIALRCFLAQDCTRDESAFGADDDVQNAEKDWRAEGDAGTEGGSVADTEAATEAGIAEDVFPEGAPGGDDVDGVEYWHKPNGHKHQAYTAAEKLKWVAQLDVAVSVRALARESGIHRKCLANWKRAADFLKEAHSARKRIHGRGRASWYRLMEIKVYERLLDWRC